MPGQYARDQDIGKTTETPGTPVTVTNLSEVTVVVDNAKDVTEDTLAELKKIRRGTEIIGGQDIGEVT
ncbi:hypothetical protein LCGC14_1500620 [marine sediment metagenome]|uniref:Uncharacterized protein n=1 Tax=marine sediment metagenome TaxID=412755 RepID=A0A0F9J4Q0_9ZZZZ